MTARLKFSLALQKARENLGLTQEKAAEIFKVSARWYQKVESGKSTPDFDLLCRLCKFYSIDITTFVEEE